MQTTITELRERIAALERELEAKLAERRADLRITVDNGRVLFEDEILRRHKELRSTLSHYVRHARPLVAASAFVIYPVLIPILMLDLFVTTYQTICFPIYGIDKVRRSEYLIFDRRHLAYLNVIQKINCAYCSYVNGIIGYVREIGARTEKYWCPIKHARRVISAHRYYAGFQDYGDADGFTHLE